MATDFGAALPVRNSPQTGEELKVVLTDPSGAPQASIVGTALKVDGSAVTQPVSGTVTANIGTTGGLALDATLTNATQKTKIVDSAGTNLATVSAAGAVKVDGSAVTQPVSGTVTANIGTTGGLALDATLTNATQKTKIVDSAGTNLATVSAAGAVKVDGSAVTQPVSGTVTANQGTAAATASAWPTKVTDGTNVAAVKAASTAAVAADPALVVAVSPNNTVNVNVVSSNQTNGVTTHVETANTAANATAFFELVPGAFPFYLDSVWTTASGKHKIEVWLNAAGKASAAAIRTGGTQLLTGFGTAATPNVAKDFDGNAVVTASNSVYLIWTNMDNQSQSMYGTIGGNT